MEEKVKTKRKIYETIEKIINSIWFPIIIGILILCKTIFFYKCTLYKNEEIDYKIIYVTILLISICIGIIEVLPNKGKIICSIIFDLFISIVLFADNLYYSYSGTFTSVAQISNLQYGEQIIDTLPALLQAKHFIYFLDIIVVLLIIFSKKIRIQNPKESNLKNNIAKCVVIFVAIVLYFKIANRYILKANEYQYNKDMQVKEASIYGYHISDINNIFNIKKQVKYRDKQSLKNAYDNLQEDYKKRYKESKYNLNGIANGKNIIILQLESIQEFVINKTINGKEITPNFNKFINENIEISNMFMQSYSTTADSEFSTLTSLYPVENGMAFSKYYSNTYNDIFRLFHRNNYTTSYMHGNYGGFWNRQNVYTKMKVDNLELKDKFNDTSENIMGYLSDELLYRQAVQKLKNYQEPFVSYIVSASSHTGFSLDGLQDRSKVDIDVGKYEDTFFGDYLESVNYADYAFGIFIDELKNEGLYEDTVILIYGDHNGIMMDDINMIDFLQKIDPNLTDVDIKLNYIRVASAIKIPGVKKLKIEKPVSKLDIKPTLKYICGLDKQGELEIGTNMFGDKDFICLNNEIIVTDKYYYDEKWYDIDNGNEIDINNLNVEEQEKFSKYYNNMKTELDISNSIIINNLLKPIK